MIFLPQILPNDNINYHSNLRHFMHRIVHLKTKYKNPSSKNNIIEKLK